MSRRLYVDIDDVLSRTIERLIDLLERTHARRVDVDDVRHFDLGRSFGLDAAETRAFMAHAHSDAEIEAIEPTPGAAEVLDAWGRDGHTVELVTGRPPATNAASRRWLARHRLAHDALHHLDKWGRPTWNDEGLPAIRFEDLHEMDFAFAVEDSLDTAARLVEEFDLPVALVDRPWNRDLDRLPRETRAHLVRCADWRAVAACFTRYF